MALKMFTKGKRVNGKPTQWLVNANRNVGVFFLNNLIIDDLKLVKGMKGMLACDDATNEWYVTFGNDLPGFSLRVLSNHDYKTRLCFSGKAAVISILNDIKAERAATFVISQRPKIMDGLKWYRIMTKRPQRIN